MVTKERELKRWTTREHGCTIEFSRFWDFTAATATLEMQGGWVASLCALILDQREDMTTPKQLPCQYCGKPVELKEPGKPALSHWQCTYDALAERRAAVQLIYFPQKK